MRQGYIHSVRLTTLMLGAIAQFSLGMAVTLLFTSAAWAEAGTDKAENREQQPSLMNLDKDAVHNLSHANRNNLKAISIPKILQLSEIEHPNTSAQMLLGQSPAVPNLPSVPPYQGGKQGGEIVQVTSVKANPSPKGVEVILQTSQGQQLQLVNRSAGNSFITNIPNAQLRLPNSDAFTFRSEKPLAGITEITVTNFDVNTIRVTVTGEAGVPTVELYDSPNEGLIFSVASAASSTQQEQPTSEIQPQQPSVQSDEPIELVVTGEQDRYNITLSLYCELSKFGGVSRFRQNKYNHDRTLNHSQIGG